VLNQEIELNEWTTTPVEYYNDTDTTDKIRWVRVGFLFGMCFVSYIVGSLPVRPLLILFTCAIAMTVGLMILRTWELLILACLLFAIDHLPMWLIPGMSTFNEPALLKLTKDIIAVGLLLAAVKFRPIVPRRFLATYFFFAIYILLRTLFQPGAIALTVVHLRYILLYPFLGMVLTGALDSVEKITKLLRILIVTAVLVVLFGFYEIAVKHQTHYSGYITFGPITQRMVSTLGSPNNVALFLQLPILYLLSGLFMKVDRRFWLLIPLLVFWAGMFLTFSRTSFVLAMVGALCVAAMLRNFRAVAIVTFLLVIGTTALVIVYHGREEMANLLGSRLDVLVNFVSESTESGQIFLFGRGLGSGLIETGIKDDRLAVSVVTDNFYTNLLRMSGVTGLALFMLLLSHLISLCLKAGKQIYSPQTRRLYITLMAWNIVFILYGMAFTAFTLYPSALIYWISVFWILTLPGLDTASYQEQEPMDPVYYTPNYGW
jgi:hypothetical protein